MPGTARMRMTPSGRYSKVWVAHAERTGRPIQNNLAAMPVLGRLSGFGVDDARFDQPTFDEPQIGRRAAFSLLDLERFDGASRASSLCL